MLHETWLRPLATLGFVVILATIFSPRAGGFPIFWHTQNLANVMRQISDIGILAVGMTLVIISGGIDLSVGSLLALSGTVFAHLLADLQWSPTASILAALVAAAMFGLVSGVTVAGLNMQPFIVTLAVMIGSRGFARWLVGNATIDIGFGDDYAARIVQFIAQKTVVVPAFLVVCVVALILLNGTRFGRYLFAVGGSESAARLSGIQVSWVKIRVYALSGLAAGVAGILHSCQTHQGSPNAGIAYELDAIAAAVIGGTSLAGGRGGIFGTFVGALALGILSNLLGLRNVDENVQWMLKAIIIVFAVWLQLVGSKRTE
ncbi:MAG: ABC transporter permease [Candidatus Hydrogenedentes bacterium]|nr:ABC transporter permease [Candidatus Hydrogenedentota bacterium]